jgi:tetratricopeptide (TPR) repeat protein
MAKSGLFSMAENGIYSAYLCLSDMEPKQQKRGRRREPRLYDDEVTLIKTQISEKFGSQITFYERVDTEAKSAEYKDCDPPKSVQTIDRTFDDAFSRDPSRRRSLPKFYWKVLLKLLGIKRENLPSQATATTAAPTEQVAPAGRGERDAAVSCSPKTDPEVTSDHSKLPWLPYKILGREEELEELTRSWQNRKICRSFTFYGLHGIGKTSLVSRWLSDPQYGGAVPHLVYNCPAQGAGEGNSSTDPFFRELFERLHTKFGMESVPDSTHPTLKGHKLAEAIEQYDVALILDGAERFQEVSTGQLRTGLEELLESLRPGEKGQVIITTQLQIKHRDGQPFDMGHREGTHVQRELLRLDKSSSVSLLRKFLPEYEEEELTKISEPCDGDPYVLEKVGIYLQRNPGSATDSVRLLEKALGDKPDKTKGVLGIFENWLMGKPEEDVLRILSLFDGPAEKDAISELRKAVIPNLNDKLHAESEWLKAVQSLIDLKLIEKANNEGSLSVRPLERWYFRDRLRQDNSAWHEAHDLLFRYFKRDMNPARNADEADPLLCAVAHACQAGEYQLAYDLYWTHLRHEHDNFLAFELGHIVDEHLLLLRFFPNGKWTQPAEGLIDEAKARVLHDLALSFRLLGELEDENKTIAPLEEAFRIVRNRTPVNDAVEYARRLSLTQLTRGEIAKAKEWAGKAVALATINSGIPADDRAAAHAGLGHLLHQEGRIAEANRSFEEAIRILKDSGKRSLAHLRGRSWVLPYRYCELLFEQQRYSEVCKLIPFSPSGVATWLTRGLSALVLAKLEFEKHRLSSIQPKKAGDLFRDALDYLRKAGQQEFIVSGLLAQAEFYRLTEQFSKAQEALSDVDKGLRLHPGMRLLRVDYHLESARLMLASSAAAHAAVTLKALHDPCQQVELAGKLIRTTFYYRRSLDLKKIEGHLKDRKCWTALNECPYTTDDSRRDCRLSKEQD